MRYLIIPLLLITLFSCDKYRAKKYAGTYWCTVNNHYQSGGNGTYTTFNSELEVIQDGKFIIVESRKFHVDSLKTGAYYIHYGSPNNYAKIQILNNEIYFYTHGGGLGGYSSKEYSGTKMK